MIDRASIMAWNEQAPWTEPAMVEQDLIICKALVCIFSDDFLAENLAFRGGTALHKLYLQPQIRYSEDIDLVQIHPGPIKPIMLRLGEVLSWMPDKVTKQKRYNNTMLFRMESEVPPVQPIRLKVEINCYEHFNVLGLQKIPFAVDNPWFKGQCELTTYALDELVGTKLRALYQRKKGRDLLDLQVALNSGKIDINRVLECYRQYIEFVVDKMPTYKQFVQNMEQKMKDPEFLGDSDILLRVGAEPFDPVTAYELVKEQLIDRMPGNKCIFLIVKSVIDRFDLCGLLEGGAPEDEFDEESREIANRISKDRTPEQIAVVIADVFNKAFNLYYSPDIYIKPAKKIKVLLSQG